MIVPSIDLMNGRAVQLRHGREFVLDGGEPLARLDEFAVAGEVAVVDLDAALGQGSNAPLMRAMVRRAPCRVGGGIRSLDAARAWLDAGARKVVLGTAATPELCGQLPRDRVIALHARRLTFLHPIQYEPITLEAPLPACWSDLGLTMPEV